MSSPPRLNLPPSSSPFELASPQAGLQLAEFDEILLPPAGRDVLADLSGADERVEDLLPLHAHTGPSALTQLQPVRLDAAVGGFQALAEQPGNSSASSEVARQDRELSAGPSSLPSTRRTHSAPSSLERKLEVNRAAQKRFRQRQKARAQQVEEQLATTKTQLDELRQAQAQLEMRNQLLESAAKAQSALSMQPEDALLWKGDAAWQEQIQLNQHQQKALVLTVWPQSHWVTVREVSQLPLAKFANLYTLYVQKLATCLLDEPQGSAAPLDLLRWTAELSSLVLAVALCNPSMLHQFCSSRLDLGSVVQEKASDVCYSRLLIAMLYSEEQVQDLLLLRRLFYGRQAQLLKQRRALVSQLSSQEGSILEPEAQNNYEALTQVAAELRANAAEEQILLLQCCCACFRGIHTSKQCATGVVHMYPFPLLRDRLFAILASERGEPSVPELLNDNSKSDLQHVADWRHVIDYVETITLSNLEVHMPLLQAMSGPLQSGQLPTDEEQQLQQLPGIPPRAI